MKKKAGYLYSFAYFSAGSAGPEPVQIMSF